MVYEKGDKLYYWKSPLQIHYRDYVRSVVYRLVIRPADHVTQSCDRSAYKAHDRVGGLPVRYIKLGQTLGDTNVHGLAAILDDRIPGHLYIRLVTIGLYPGSGDVSRLYCHYPCPGTSGQFCSSPVSGVLLLAGNHSDYPLGKESLLSFHNQPNPCPGIPKPN